MSLSGTEIFLCLIDTWQRVLMKRKERIIFMNEIIFHLSTNRTQPMLPIRKIQRFINDWNHKLEYILQYFSSFNNISFLHTIWCKHFTVHFLAHKKLIYQPREKCPETMF